MEGLNNILNQFSREDLEKLKVLLSIIPTSDQREVVTLRVFAEEYQNFIKDNRSKAYHCSVVISYQHLTEYFGLQRPVQSIGLRDAESFLAHLQRKVPKGYRVYYKTLKAAFNKAIDWGYIKENCFMKLKLPKKQQVNPAYIDEKTLEVICEKLEVEIIKEIVTLGFYTGMRLNELINLTWRNVDLGTRTITVGDENFTTKGRNQRYIPICEEAFEVIMNRKTEEVKCDTPRILRIQPSQRGELQDDFVFCKANGASYTGDYISRRFKLACRKAGVDKAIHFHSLRHSFASNLAQRGVSLYTIKELLGHSSIATTEIYSHLNMDALKEAIRMFDKHQPPLNLPQKGRLVVNNKEKF